MKTVEIKIENILYKEIKRRAKKRGITMAEYIMDMCNRGMYDTTSFQAVQGCLQDTLFDAEDPDDLDALVDELNDIIEQYKTDVLATFEDRK